MKTYKAVGENGDSITVQPVMVRVDVTPIDSECKQYLETFTKVLVQGIQVELNLDNSFYHPVNGRVYELVSSNE